MALAARHGKRMVASAVLTGGWRLTVETALRVMLDTMRSLDHAGNPVCLSLHFLTQGDLEAARSTAAERGVSATI
jgi:hypothetical protein